MGFAGIPLGKNVLVYSPQAEHCAGVLEPIVIPLSLRSAAHCQRRGSVPSLAGPISISR